MLRSSRRVLPVARVLISSTARSMEPLGVRDPCASAAYYPSLGDAEEVAAVAAAHSLDCVAVALLNGEAVLHYGVSAPAAIASGGSDGGRRVVLRGHDDALTAAAWSPDDSVVATASLDRTVRIWCERTAACLHTLTRTGLQPSTQGLEPGRVVVPRRCQSGTQFDVVAARGTSRAEIAIPGGNPSVEVLPAGSRVFEVVAPCVPIVAVEKAPPCKANAGGMLADRASHPTRFVRPLCARRAQRCAQTNARDGVRFRVQRRSWWACSSKGRRWYCRRSTTRTRPTCASSGTAA